MTWKNVINVFHLYIFISVLKFKKKKTHPHKTKKKGNKQNQKHTTNKPNQTKNTNKKPQSKLTENPHKPKKPNTVVLSGQVTRPSTPEPHETLWPLDPLPTLKHSLVHWARIVWLDVLYTMCLSLHALLTILFIIFHVITTFHKELLSLVQVQFSMKEGWQWDQPRWECPQNRSENLSWNNALGFFLSLGRIFMCSWEIMQTEEISFKSFTNFH